MSIYIVAKTREFSKNKVLNIVKQLMATCLKIIVVIGVCETQCHTVRKCNFNYMYIYIYIYGEYIYAEYIYGEYIYIYIVNICTYGVQIYIDMPINSSSMTKSAICIEAE